MPWYRTVGGDQGNAVDSLENSLVVWGTGPANDIESPDYTIADLLTLQPIHYLVPLLQVLSHCCMHNPAFLEPPRRWHLRWFPQQAAIQDPWLGYMAAAARTEAVAKKGLRHQSRHDLGLRRGIKRLHSMVCSRSQDLFF